MRSSQRREGFHRLVGQLRKVEVGRGQVVGAGLESGEEEQLVDQVAERLDIVVHGGEVANGILGHAVLQRLDGGPQRGERCAQVVADGRQEKAAFALVGQPLRFQLLEAGGHQVQRTRDGADLVLTVQAGTGGEISTAHRGDRAAYPFEVGRERLGKTESQCQAEPEGEHQEGEEEAEVVRGEEHLPSGEDDGDERTRHRCHGHRGERGAQRAAAAHPLPREHQHGHPSGRQRGDEDDEIAPGRRVGPERHLAGNERGTSTANDHRHRPEQRRGAPSIARRGRCRAGRARGGHGSNRYPTPQTVAIHRGVSGSLSIFCLMRRTWTVTVAGSW